MFYLSTKLFRKNLFFPQLLLTAIVLLFSPSYSAQSQSRLDKTLDSISDISGSAPDKGLLLIDSVISYYQKAKNPFAYARSISLKSWLLVHTGQYEESLRLAHNALAEQKKLGTDTLGLGLTYNRIGIANLYFNRDKDALNYINEALNIFTTLGDTSKIDMALNNLAAVYSNLKDYEKVLKYDKQVLRLRIPTGDHHWIGFSHLSVAMAFRMLDKLDSAEYHLKTSERVFEHSKSPTPPHLFAEMAELYRQTNNIPQAIKYAELALIKSMEIDHVQAEMYAKEILADLYSRDGDYKKAHSMLKEFYQMKEFIDSSNSIEAITEIEEKYKNAEKEIEISDLKARQLEANAEIQQAKLLALYALVTLLIGLVVFGYLYLKKAQKQKLEASELNAKISETKLIALRAQMNPHFIFNCLNTTQNFIMASQKLEAYQYLSKFAKLLRQVLENSNDTFIPIEDEISQIHLYLQLEQIRFDNKFSFDLHTDTAFEEGVFEIPGMIIQPIIENAILHGLINRNDSKGYLEVSISKQNNNSVLCKIQDNGVGRAAAAKIKENKKVHYKSVAIPNVIERLKILTGNDKNIKINIIDLFNEGEPSGTLVELTLPYQ